jgi:predicted nucleic acid-binding protein
MVTGLFDTNILIDHLNGVKEAAEELGRYETKAISAVTWMEVMAGALPHEDPLVRNWLNTFRLIPIDDAVAARAVHIRRIRRVKLPDAIILATAHVHSLLLVTRNTNDFPEDEPGVRVPYRVGMPVSG